MKKEYLLSLTLLFLAGCNPFNARENQTKEFMVKAAEDAKRLTLKYKPNIRPIKPYKVYEYQSELEDPFRLRQFLIQEKEKKSLATTSPNGQCSPPACMPPTPHKKQFLESYGLGALSFVGTLGGNSVGLIKTPDYGVVPVKLGDYIGPNDGKVQAINESALILQEKIRKNGIWENKKTILMITQ